MWRELKKKSICATATDKGTKASCFSWTAPSSSVASVRLSSHQGWQLSGVPLYCVGNCSFPGGGALELQRELESTLKI